MSWYAFNLAGWFTGEVADGSPSSTPEQPPTSNTEETPGEPRARWKQWGWAVQPYPEPTPQPVAYAINADGWYAGEVTPGTPNSTRAKPEIQSTTATPGEPRAKWEAGAWIVRAWAPLPRHIARRAFTNRFTQAEEALIDLASIDNPSGTQQQRMQAAVLRAQHRKISDSAYVDLDLQQTRDGVFALESAGLLAVGRALQILDAPIQSHERYSLRESTN